MRKFMTVVVVMGLVVCSAAASDPASGQSALRATRQPAARVNQFQQVLARIDARDRRIAHDAFTYLAGPQPQLAQFFCARCERQTGVREDDFIVPAAGIPAGPPQPTLQEQLVEILLRPQATIVRHLESHWQSIPVVQRIEDGIRSDRRSTRDTITILAYLASPQPIQQLANAPYLRALVLTSSDTSVASLPRTSQPNVLPGTMSRQC